MALPVWSTTVTVYRSDQPDDQLPDQELQYRPIATGIHCHPSKLSRVAGGQPGSARSDLMLRLLMDPLPDGLELTHLDVVLDEGQPDKAVFRPLWVAHRSVGGPLEHLAAEAVREEFEQGFDYITVLPAAALEAAAGG